MATVKLSRKGQIIIPKSIRDTMHLHPGAELVISITATGLSLTPNTLFAKTTHEEVCGVLAKPGQTIPDDDGIKARIKAKLLAKINARKE
jgi:AbrB family looped-hinge helix DNA binding protein